MHTLQPPLPATVPPPSGWSPPPSGIAPNPQLLKPRQGLAMGPSCPFPIQRAPPIPDLHETSLTLLSHPKAAPVVAFSVHFRPPMIKIVFIVFILPLDGLEEDIKLDNSP